MALHQHHHQQGHGPGGGADHARAAADKGDDHGNAEGGMQADFRVSAGNDREGDGLQDQRQCYYQTFMSFLRTLTPA